MGACELDRKMHQVLKSTQKERRLECMVIKRHELSAIVSQELLSRPSPSIETPSVVIQLVLVPDTPTRSTGKSVKQAVDDWCQAHDQPPSGAAKYHHVHKHGLSLRWEQHTEFSSIVLINDDVTDWQKIDLTWLEGTQARLLTGSVIIVESSEIPNGWLDEHDGAVGGSVMDGQAVLATTLQPNSIGLVEYRIGNIALNAARLGRLTQRIYEIETYRVMALLGLPLAKTTGQQLDLLEERLINSVKRMGTDSELSDDQTLLDELFSLAQDSEELMANTDYRFSATQAYGQIVQDRLSEIHEEAVPTRQPLGEFLERRFEPAIRTTRHIVGRQQNLSARIARAVSLARTRVEVTLQTQHKTQLESMSKRAQLQLRLQRTVEGLSVMAISYYAIGILAYLLGGWIPSEKSKLLISIVSPILLIIIWWALKQWRARLLEEPDGDG